jgi:hypothetical protein
MRPLALADLAAAAERGHQRTGDHCGRNAVSRALVYWRSISVSAISSLERLTPPTPLANGGAT